MNDELKSFLLEVNKLFFRYGVKSVTMDDIARELGISKKTIYTKVSDKTDLVNRVMDYRLETDEAMIKTLVSEDTNAIDETFDICNKMGDIMGDMNPAVMYDLQKYYPQVFKKFTDHKKTFVLDMVIQNLKKGKKQGLFRPEFDEEIIARIYITKMDAIFDPKIFEPETFNFVNVVGEMMIYHTYGVASQKGKEHLDKRLNKTENK